MFNTNLKSILKGFESTITKLDAFISNVDGIIEVNTTSIEKLQTENKEKALDKDKAQRVVSKLKELIEA